MEVPEGTTPGIARYYATAVTFEGYAQPVLGRTFSGRPVKLEGNSDHPASGGSTDMYTQAALMGLYDPFRSQAPRRHGDPVTWRDTEAMLVDLGRKLDASAGEGFRVVTGRTTSPTLIRQMNALIDRWPKARWHVSSPVFTNASEAAARAIYGKPLSILPRLEEAQFVVSLDGDILGAGPFQNHFGRAFGAARRARARGRDPFRLMVAEPVPTLTGIKADRRVAVEPADIAPLLSSVAAAFSAGGAQAPELAPGLKTFADQAIAGLRRAGDRGLLLVGDRHGPELQALALQVMHATGASERVLNMTEPVAQPGLGPENGMDALATDLENGSATDVLFLDVNPVYTESGSGFLDALRKARLAIHCGLFLDETAGVCAWHLPLQHDLESWSDARAVDGTVSLIQPLVKPFLDVRSVHSILAMLAGRFAGDRDLVMGTWKPAWGGDFESRWRQSLLAGFVEASASQPVSASLVGDPSRPGPTNTRAGSGLILAVAPDPSIWDGRLGENAWAQETPKPLSKMTWGNVVTISPALATKRGLKTGDEISISAGAMAQRAVVWVQPGQADNTLGLTTGYGRTASGQTEATIGANAFLLMGKARRWFVEGVEIAATGTHVDLPTTQPEQDMHGRDFARTMALSAAGKTNTEQAREASPPPSFYADQQRSGPQWGMSIDLDTCIGCNACVVACVAENNIPMVGRELVAEGREMHWLRIDHYYDGAAEDPDFHFQPVPCMHCEEAPCEMGCPVNAAVHSSDGLNLQVYNRCIGTRTCSSFCPYKVRRFNWFDFTGDDPEPIQAMRNPDVTVRMRGVMEKCTYCVQRIEETRITAQKEGRPIRDGEIKTACQQVCPSQAITFGDVSDPATEVSQKKREERNYLLLEEVNTRPRTSYLARLVDDDKPKGELG